MTELQTERLLLRPWYESDAAALFKYACDPEVGPRAGWEPHKNIEESLEIIKNIFSAEGMWAVVLKETGELIGCVGYLLSENSNLQIPADQAEVGYWIARPYWGRGICTEALRAVVEYCFAKGFSALWGDYFPENPASGRVMAKCGFLPTNEEAVCPKLEVGGDKPVRVMKLSREGCLICHAPLEYLHEDIELECLLCHKKEQGKTRCVNGHYVCNECHSRGLDSIFGLCLHETSKNPLEIINKMMRLPFCHMHGPEHHVIVGSALLTAYKNAGGEIELSKALMEIKNRGSKVPGGTCGFWGACGAGISSGMFLAIISDSTPLAGRPFALANLQTAAALTAIGTVGGPRCCKRDSYLSILAAIDFVKEHYGVIMEKSPIVCGFSAQNSQCIGKRCPFCG